MKNQIANFFQFLLVRAFHCSLTFNHKEVTLMTKTIKIKLVVTSALVLGAVATIGGTYAALTLSGGNKEAHVDSGIDISDVVIQNNVVNLAASVNDGTLHVD